MGAELAGGIGIHRPCRARFCSEARKTGSLPPPQRGATTRRSARTNTLRDDSSALTLPASLVISSAESARENARRASASAPWASSTVQ